MDESFHMHPQGIMIAPQQNESQNGVHLVRTVLHMLFYTGGDRQIPLR